MIENLRPAITTRTVVGVDYIPTRIWACCNGMSKFYDIDPLDPPVIAHFKAACRISYEQKLSGSLCPGSFPDGKIVWVWNDDAPTHYKVSRCIV